MLLKPSKADDLLTVLRRTPVFRKHPELVRAFNECRYKRFIGHPRMAGMGMKQMAARLGGALALAHAEPPGDIVSMIVSVLDADHTFLLMCEKEQDRINIAEQVNAVYDTRDEITATDAAHRIVII